MKTQTKPLIKKKEEKQITSCSNVKIRIKDKVKNNPIVKKTMQTIKDNNLTIIKVDYSEKDMFLLTDYFVLYVIYNVTNSNLLSYVNQYENIEDIIVTNKWYAKKQEGIWSFYESKHILSLEQNKQIDTNLYELFDIETSEIYFLPTSANFENYSLSLLKENNKLFILKGFLNNDNELLFSIEKTMNLESKSRVLVTNEPFLFNSSIFEELQLSIVTNEQKEIYYLSLQLLLNKREAKNNWCVKI